MHCGCHRNRWGAATWVFGSALAIRLEQATGGLDRMASQVQSGGRIWPSPNSSSLAPLLIKQPLGAALLSCTSSCLWQATDAPPHWGQRTPSNQRCGAPARSTSHGQSETQGSPNSSRLITASRSSPRNPGRALKIYYAAWFGWRDHELDQRPLLIRQVISKALEGFLQAPLVQTRQHIAQLSPFASGKGLPPALSE